MKIAVINGTNRIGNRSIEISRNITSLVKAAGHETFLIDLENFTDLFRGDFLNYKNTDVNQREDLKNMIMADVLLFVVPTYHHGIPAPLKNFLDILKCDECFDNKVIGIIASNPAKSDGANQARDVINGILSFGKLNSFVIPRINVTNFDDIDEVRLKEFVEYSASFLKPVIAENSDFTSISQVTAD